MTDAMTPRNVIEVIEQNKRMLDSSRWEAELERRLSAIPPLAREARNGNAEAAQALTLALSDLGAVIRAPLGAFVHGLA